MADTRSLRELNRATLARQALLERERRPVAKVIGGLAGLQAQHADPPYIALWSRRADQAIADLEEALLDRSVAERFAAISRWRAASTASPSGSGRGACTSRRSGPIAVR